MKRLLISLSVVLYGLGSAPEVSAQGKPILNKTKIESLSHKSKYGFAKVSSPTRRGAKAQRFEIRHGDCGRTSGYDDCSNDRGRIERKEKPKNAMAKPDGYVWYGYSILIPSDFVSLGRANTILSQAKTENHLVPLWAMTFNDNPYLLYGDGKTCKLGSMSSWKGRWIDVTVFAHYARSGQPVYFQLYKDGKLLCQRKTPIMPRNINKSNQKIGLKYGIYSSFVSRYLQKHATKAVKPKAYKQDHEAGRSKSPTGRPFDYDWGVQLPTHVVYYDEMRYGKSRAEVDVRMLEAAGAKPVD